MKNVTVTIDGKEVEIQVSEKSYKKHFNKNEAWKPKYGEKYFWLDAHNNDTWDRWDDFDGDKARYEIGNCFQTEEEAKAYSKYLKALAKIKRSSNFVPDWNDFDQCKYYVYYDHEEGRLDWDLTRSCQLPTTIYYEAQRETLQAIKDLKEEYLTIFNIEEAK